MAVTLFHNPGAGAHRVSSGEIMAALRAAGYDPVLSELGRDDWAAAMGATDELAIVSGGDGSISRIVELIGDRDLPVAILPMGSGNNIARSLGLLAEPLDIIERLPTARTGPLRVCRAKGPWGEERFVEGVGLGALARSVLELQEEELDGSEKLIRGRESFTKAIETQEPLGVTVSVDGQAIEGSLLLVEVLNLAMIGPNIRFVDHTVAKGEQLSVALLSEAGRAAMLEWLADGGSGVAPVQHVQGRRVRLEGVSQPLRLEDKTRAWDGSRVEIETVGHRVRVLRPGDDR